MSKFFSLSLVFLVAITITTSHNENNHKPYIIHMDNSKMPSPFTTSQSWHASTLESLSSPNDVVPVHLYTYNHVIDGFSAVLSPDHVQQLEKFSGHIATYPDSLGQIHTTHSPKFLGLRKNLGLWPESGFGDDMIIGVIDSGIWPESESFNDDGMAPVPERWRGECESGTEFNSSNCNRKLIGARSFSKGLKRLGLNISKTDDYDSPRDYMGHGTHTSSTAAGGRVENVDYFGYAKGTATGIAPKARLAMYKVLFYNGSYDAAASDTLAAMDQAIEDGVDLMSLSLAFIETSFEQNPIAIGSFAAVEKGIFVSCSAGNAGPNAYTIFNGAPWITTVGAGTIDRDFAAKITLGNGNLTVIGRSIYPENLFVSNFPIYFGNGNRSKEICDIYNLDPNEVAGKFIFCDFNDEVNVHQQIYEFERSGAAGGIFSTDSGQFLRPDDFNLPIVTVLPENGKMMKNYLINSGIDSTVSVKFQFTVLGTKAAPEVAYFSSRGPDRVSPWILKPDLIAPGVNILAAWVPNRAETPIREDDYLLTDYAIVSGTSMSAPHVAGVAALLKSTHRSWSPAAIRSAMMTTADITDNTNSPIIDMTTGIAGTPLDYGAGHINPNKAMDPGLIYDIETHDYINYLCGLNYTTKQIKIITRVSNFSCEKSSLDLNYPSFIVILNDTNSTSVAFKRVLTNVDDSSSVYHAVVKAPAGMTVAVEPATVVFDGKDSRAEFSMRVDIELGREESYYIGNYGFLSWYEVNGNHIVTSPIVSAYAP